MMFKSAQGDLNGFLDAGSHIVGELHFDDTFRIDGKLTGKVISDGELVVGERGEVDGEIDVRRVYVSGIVKGRVRAGRSWSSRRVAAPGPISPRRCSRSRRAPSSRASARWVEAAKPAEDAVRKLPVAKSS
jgi:hypothetical protein